MTSHGTRKSHLRFWLWLGVIGVCLGGGGIRLWQNHQRKVAKSIWENDKARLSQAWDQARERVEGLTHRWVCGPEGELRGHTRKEFERILNDGKPFEPLPGKADNASSPQDEWVLWVDPTSHREFELRFYNGQCFSIGVRGVNAGESPPPPVLPPFDLFTHKVQRAFAGSFSFGIGTVAWLIAFALYLGWKQQRKVLAEVMLALTLLCGTAWLTWPSYSLTVKGVFSNDMLFWAMLMLVVSLAALATSRTRTTHPAWPTCAHCGYNLTGNVSGVCPECGEAVTKDSRRRLSG